MPPYALPMVGAHPMVLVPSEYWFQWYTGRTIGRIENFTQCKLYYTILSYNKIVWLLLICHFTNGIWTALYGYWTWLVITTDNMTLLLNNIIFIATNIGWVRWFWPQLPNWDGIPFSALWLKFSGSPLDAILSWHIGATRHDSQEFNSLFSNVLWQHTNNRVGNQCYKYVE